MSARRRRRVQWASIALLLFAAVAFGTSASGAGDHDASPHIARHSARRHPASHHPARRHPARRHPARRHPARRHPASRSHPAAVAVRLTIPAGGRTQPIPRSFLGFSTEYWGLPVDARHLMLYRRLISLVHVRGDGRFVLRIGGNSSDHSFWDPDLRHAARWMFRITPGWVRSAAAVVGADHLRVIVDLNLVTGTPALAGEWARQVMRRMPRGSVAGFEIGNEPDIYDRAFWLAHIGMNTAGRLPLAITSGSYAAAYDAYARALAPAARRVPLLGPALAEPTLDRAWISGLLAGPHPRLGAVTVHDYPFTACALPGAPKYPSIARLLDPRLVERMVNSLHAAVRTAHAAGLPVRVTEFNSVTCGGVAGISNSFATALWAPQALFSMIRAGISAADLHVRAFSINSPFRFHRREVDVRPLFYGLCLFSRMLAPGARLLQTRLTRPSAGHLTAWAVRDSARRLRVLLINTSRRAMRVRLALPGRRPVAVQRLLAPGPGATGHVTLAGQHLNHAARWTRRRRISSVPPRDGAYAVTLPRYSAALVTARTAR